MISNRVIKIKKTIALMASIIILPISTYSTVSKAEVGTASHAVRLARGESGSEDFSAGTRCNICVGGNDATVEFSSPNKSWEISSGNCSHFTNTGRNTLNIEYTNQGPSKANISFEC